MGRWLESRDYFVKCLGFILLLGFISLGAIGGCGNNGGDDTQALTENDFAEDPSIVADPTGGVVVIFLEPPDSEEPENDTGEIGVDIIPYTYKSTLEHTFCWEDDDPDAEHFMVLEDSDGNEIFILDVNGECITVVLEAGDYVMIIHHDGRIETTHPIFIIPSQENGVQADTSTDGLNKNGKVLISNLLQNLHNTITHNAKAQQSTKKIVKTLLKTDACPNCNLTGAKLKNAKLSGADLSGADLTDADLTKAILTGADLTGAILTGVTLGDTMFDNATWCDSLCTCGTNSIDTCVGCAPIDICTALASCEADCDDGSMCTNDICDPTTFLCTNEPLNCDDGDACTIDSCDSNATTPAQACQNQPIDCDDGILCTFDTCLSTEGCISLPGFVDECTLPGGLPGECVIPSQGPPFAYATALCDGNTLCCIASDLLCARGCQEALIGAGNNCVSEFDATDPQHAQQAEACLDTLETCQITPPCEARGECETQQDTCTAACPGDCKNFGDCLLSPLLGTDALTCLNDCWNVKAHCDTDNQNCQLSCGQTYINCLGAIDGQDKFIACVDSAPPPDPCFAACLSTGNVDTLIEILLNPNNDPDDCSCDPQAECITTDITTTCSCLTCP